MFNLNFLKIIGKKVKTGRDFRTVVGRDLNQFVCEPCYEKFSDLCKKKKETQKKETSKSKERKSKSADS